jgi:predicted metal-dependent peptidase
MARVEDMGLTSQVAGDTGRWPKLKLSVQHQKLWDETRAAMLWVVPSFSDIWYSMMVDRDGEHAWFTDQIPTAATDDKFLYVNPEWYFQLSLDERIFVNCHEIEHAMFGHCGMFYMLTKSGEIRYSDGVTLPVNFELMNVSADYVINAQLVEAKIGVMPDDGLHWPEFISGEMGVLDAYRLLWKRQKDNEKRQRQQQRGKPGGQGGQGSQGAGQKPDDGQGQSQSSVPDDLKRTTKKGNTQDAGSGKSFDQHLKPGQGRGKPANEAMSERNEQSWANAVAAALESGKLRGDMPASLIRHFVGRLTPKANWQDVYFAALTRRVGNDRYSWEQLNQQLIYRGIGAPGRISYGCNLLVVAADSSGSINQHTLDVFLSESRAILDTIRPRRIIFTQCDAMVHEWTEIDSVDDLRGEVKGGGGTDFCPVFERIKSEGIEPDLLVYLTDMDGRFPSVAPSYPVVWGSIIKNVKAPFGDVVYIPSQEE